VPKRGGRGRPAADTSGADDFELLAADLARAQEGAVAAVVRAAQLSSRAGSEQKLEVFLNLARRLQSLVHREISTLDELENEIEDPDLLKGLFHVDHLSTRIRRHAENLAVLGGAVSRRQWSNPVEMTEVLRSAIAEVEQYSRVRLVPPVDGRLRGHAVADVIHLLAELVENATVFSAPHTQVLLRANLVTAGLAVEVEDRGLGMPLAEQHRMNALLADPDQVNVASLLQDGRIGLYVVSQLARRHGIQVRLGTNIYGGVQAVLVLPKDVLGAPPPELSATPAAGVATGRGGAPAPGGSGGWTAGGAPARAEGAGGSGPEGWANPSEHTGRTEYTGHASGPEHPGPAKPAPMAVPAGDGSAAGGPFAGAVEGGAVDRGPGATGTGTPAGTGMPVGSGTPGVSPAAGHSAPEAGPGPDWVEVNGNGTHAPGVPATSGAPGTPRTSGGPSGTAPPLPVRGQRGARPNPAEAQPGIAAGHRPVLAEHAGLPPTPRVGPVRGTMGKPQLPRRRAQEHLAPQLRGGPAPGPREDSGAYVEHDPGLMAAFQRGIGLAEAAPPREPATAEAPRPSHADDPADRLGQPQPQPYPLPDGTDGTAGTGEPDGTGGTPYPAPVGPAVPLRPAGAEAGAGRSVPAGSEAPAVRPSVPAGTEAPAVRPSVPSESAPEGAPRREGSASAG
jgi:hypothetical protein